MGEGRHYGNVPHLNYQVNNYRSYSAYIGITEHHEWQAKATKIDTLFTMHEGRNVSYLWQHVEIAIHNISDVFQWFHRMMIREASLLDKRCEQYGNGVS